MANHKSALKRIRQNAKKRESNRYYAKTMRNSLRNFLSSEDKKEVSEMVSPLTAMIDRVSKRNIIHKNKAANLKSQVNKHANALQ